MAKSEILDFVREKLDPLPDSALETVTFKSVREELIPKFGIDEVGSCKGDIKLFLAEYFANRAAAAVAESNSKSDVEENEESSGSDSEGSDSTDSSSDSDDDHPTIAALPAEWRESFGEVCWVKGQKTFPW
jgi:hypothetical protein